MNQTRKLGPVWLWACIVACGAILGICKLYLFRAHQRLSEEEYRHFYSPHRKFQIIVWRIPLDIAMPGQSGDATGVVRLLDDHGKVIQERAVDMVQNIDQPEWTSTNVYIKLFANWNLR